jgi:hypothetical protein
VFGNRVLKRIFGAKKDEATAGRGKLHEKSLLCLLTERVIVVTPFYTCIWEVFGSSLGLDNAYIH